MTTLAQPLHTTGGALAQAPLSSLQVNGLTKRFSGSTTPVFHDVGFEVLPGQSVALIGANGAGKSTLLRCCVRLIEPDAGEIVLAGERLSGMRGRALRRSRQRVGCRC